MGKIIGIDLGTTNSVVAVMEGKEPRVIVNEEGSRLTPSVVAWNDEGEILVGQAAKRQAVMNPANTVSSAKRFIGRRHEDAQEEAKRALCKVDEGKNKNAVFEIRGKVVTPPEVAARVLLKLKKAAEDYLGEQVTEAVITVPAYFDESQRQATKDAGRIAGLDVKRLVSDSTAAALAYGLDKEAAEVIAVYNFGGGHFDISILEVGDNVAQVIATNGDTHLGGDDVDHLVMDWLLAELKRDTGIDAANDKMVVQRLKDAAEQAKIELSNVQETTINLPFLTADASGPKDLQKQLTRTKLEQMIRPLIDRTMEPTRKALADAKLTPQEIHKVVLVGGSTRIPLVYEVVKKFFGKEPHKGMNPDEVVAIGAAVQAGVLSGDVKELVLQDVIPFSLGVETLGGAMTKMISRNTVIPTQKKEVFSTATDSQPSIEIHVLLGERTEVRYNRTLGRSYFNGIAPAAHGVPKIEVTFDIDANGILSVQAKDMATGKGQRIAITASRGLEEHEIQRMAHEAAGHAADDRAPREEREENEARSERDDRSRAMVKVPSEKAKPTPVAGTRTKTVSCSRCRAVVPQSETEISTSGGLICLSCAPLSHAHAHVARMQEDVYRRTSVASGPVDRAMKVGERARADQAARQEHEALHAIESAGVAALPTESACSRCGATVPTGKTTYAPDGQLICHSCFARNDERTDRLVAERAARTGFLLGFFLSVVGVILVVFIRNKPAEKKRIWIGFLAGTIIIYLPLGIAILAKVIDMAPRP
jgi:molecular chaperone DnaK